MTGAKFIVQLPRALPSVIPGSDLGALGLYGDDAYHRAYGHNPLRLGQVIRVLGWKRIRRRHEAKHDHSEARVSGRKIKADRIKRSQTYIAHLLIAEALWPHRQHSVAPPI